MRTYAFWAIIIALLPLILRRPFWGVALYSCLNIVRPDMLFWGGGAGAKSLIVLNVATIIGAALNFRNTSIKKIMCRELFLLLWLYIALIVSIELSQYEIHRAYYFANEIGKLFVLCLVVIVVLDNPEKVIRYENILLICIVLLGIWGIEQHFRGNVRLEGLGGRSFGDSNGVAAMLVLFLPLAFNKTIVSGNRREKVVGLISIIVVALTVIFTQSRAGFLGLVIAGMAVILRSKEKKRIIVTLLLITAAASPFITEGYKSRLATMGSKESLDGSASSRLILWQAGLMVFRDNPIFGTGLLSYPLAKLRYESEFYDLEPDFWKYVFRRQAPKVTHNTYIQVLSDGGLFAAVPYFMLIIGTFLSNMRVRKMAPRNNENKEMFALLSAIEAGIMGFCVCIMFMDALFAVFLPVQIVVCSIIRKFIVQGPTKLAVST